MEMKVKAVGVKGVKQAMHGRHAAPKGSWLLPGINPMTAYYMKPDNTQNPQPEFKGAVLPVYLPMMAKDKIHGDKPVHNAEILTRADFIDAQLEEGIKDGTIGAAYKTYFLAWACLGLTVLTYFYVHVYVAGFFAYMAGHYWGWKEHGIGWGKEWFKGKMLIHTT